MAKLVWRVKLVSERQPGMTTETELACIERDAQDALGPVYQDRQFTALFARRGQPAEASGRLALAVVLQFVEDLSDREAADVVRGRIDWKYALGPSLRP